MLLTTFVLLWFIVNTIQIGRAHCDGLIFDVVIKNVEDRNKTSSSFNKFYLNIYLNFKDKTSNLTTEQGKLGFHPKVIIFEKQQSNTNQHIIDTFFVPETDKCSHLKYIDERKCAYISERCTNDSSPSSEATSNDLYWIALLPVSNLTDFMEITVYSNDIGIKVSKRRIIKYFRSSFLETSSNPFLVENIEKKVLVPNKNMLNVHKGYYGDWSVLLDDNFLMVSTSEYNDITFVKLGLNHNIRSEPVVCTDAKQDILEILPLENKKLLSTKYGLVQLPYNQSENAQVVLSKCVSSLTILGHTPQDIIAVDKKNMQLFHWNFSTSVLSGNEDVFNFSTLLGIDYDLIDVANLNGMDHIVFLFRQKIDNKYVFRIAYVTKNNNSWALDVRSMIIDEEMKKLSLANFFYVNVWGKTIYCSLDAGHYFSQIHFDSSYEVINFWNSNLNTFIFQTSSFDLWYGKCGTSFARKLTLSPIKHFSHVLFYFNSHDEFKELIINDQGSLVCLNTRTIDIAFEHSITTVSTHNDVKEFQCCYNGKFQIEEHKYILNSHCDCVFNAMEVTTELFRKFSRILTLQHDLQNIDSVNQLLTNSKDTLVNNFLKRYSTNVLTSKESNMTRIDNIFFTFTEISLGLLKCFEMDINMEIAYSYNTKKFYNKYWTIDDFRIDFYTPYQDYLEIKVEKINNILDGIVTFRTSVCDRGFFRGRILPGEYFMNTFVQFHVNPWDLECTSERRLKNVALKIRHGCSSRKKMKIDFERSHGLVNPQCDRMNCFLYEYPFNPVFYLDDEITGTIEVYKGLYNMTIIAGGETEDSLIYYTDEQINDYNFKLGSPARIWSWLNPGEPSNGHQWLCSMTSPCAKLYPDSFGSTSKYLFLVRFKNENNDSNCDYSFDFMLKLHGMAPDSLHHALPIIIVSSILSMGMFSLIFHVETKYRRNILAMQRSVFSCIRKLLSALGKSNMNKVEPLEIIHEHSAVRLKVEDWSRKLTFEDQVDKSELSSPAVIIADNNKDVERQSIGTSMTSLRGNIGTSMTSLHLKNGLLTRPSSTHNFNSLSIAPDSY